MPYIPASFWKIFPARPSWASARRDFQPPMTPLGSLRFWSKPATDMTPRSSPHREPHWVLGRNKSLLFEFPISVSDFAGKPMCFFGGGYLRVFPYWLIERMATRVISEGRPVVFYIH